MDEDLSQHAVGHRGVRPPDHTEGWLLILDLDAHCAGGTHELKRDSASVDFVGSGVAVFNICGNRYRLVAHVRYDVGLVYVRHILTHDEYDNLVL